MSKISFVVIGHGDLYFRALKSLNLHLEQTCYLTQVFDKESTKPEHILCCFFFHAHILFMVKYLSYLKYLILRKTTIVITHYDEKSRNFQVFDAKEIKITALVTKY